MQIGSSCSGYSSQMSALQATGYAGNLQAPPINPMEATQKNDPLREYVNSLDSEEGEAIQSSLQSLSKEGKEALKSELEAFRPEADNLSQEEREEGFMQILNDVFSKYGQDTGATSALLSVYA